MTQATKNSLITVVIITAAITATGFLRDYIFYNINAYIEFISGYHNNYTEPAVYAVIKNFDLAENNYLKWLLTFLFTDIYFIISSLGIILLFKTPHKLLHILCVMYLVLIGFSIIFQAFYFISNIYLGFEVARFCMHLLQSPLPFFILIPASYLSKNMKA